MELFPKKFDLLLGKIAAIIYVVLLIGYGVYGSQFAYYAGMTKRSQLVTFDGIDALLMLWGTLILFASIAGLAFSTRKYGLIWGGICLFSSFLCFGSAYFLFH